MTGMKINSTDNDIFIDNGAGGVYDFSVSDIKAWRLVVEENGATYFSFRLDGCTQHVSILSTDPNELESNINTLADVIGKKPLLDLNNPKLSKNFNQLSEAITIELLIGVVAASSGC